MVNVSEFGRDATRVLKARASRLLLAGILICGISLRASAQPPAKQDPATLEMARALYAKQFAALMNAKTLADLKTSTDAFDTSSWVSVDRFGRPLVYCQTCPRRPSPAAFND